MEPKNNLFTLFEYLGGDQGKVYLRQGDIFVKMQCRLIPKLRLEPSFINRKSRRFLVIQVWICMHIISYFIFMNVLRSYAEYKSLIQKYWQMLKSHFAYEPFQVIFGCNPRPKITFFSESALNSASECTFFYIFLVDYFFCYLSLKGIRANFRFFSKNRLKDLI